MTPQERQLLTTSLQQLAQTRADPKDPEADALIRDALSRQPDASYLLVQRAMGLDLALKAAQAQAEKLQAELDLAMRGNEKSFVGNADSWGRGAPAAKAAQQPSAPSAPSPWGSGMLANLATTAAGVVAGSFLYQGIQQMMGHHNAGPDTNAATAASDTSGSSANDDALTSDEAAETLDDSNTTVATDDGGFDSPDLG
jgi:hypothetical protein